MKIRKTPTEIWREYEKAANYNENLDLYATVEQNNNFYNGKQWEGFKGDRIMKPVFNFIKEAVNLYISTLISDKIGYSMKPMLPTSPEVGAQVSSVLKYAMDEVFETARLRYLNRKAIRNCAIDGDTCMYFYFDPDEDTGFDYKGRIKAEVIDNTNVLFGNPSTEEVDVQPYILIAFRRLVCDVRDEAEANGLPVDEIRADDESRFMNSDRDYDNNYVTVILKLWRENGTVRVMKVTKNAVIKEETDTKLKRYPLCYMTWESVKNSYHGRSPITPVIPNQIFVNKMYALSFEYLLKMAFPKLLYDRTKLPNGVTNEIGKAIAVTGNPQEAFMSVFSGADMSSQVMSVTDSTISKTKEHMGAYDAALGNVNPDNTSAIIATQQAAAAPLDMQRMDFYYFVERYVRIIIDFMRVEYGTRLVRIEDEVTEFDFRQLDDYALSLDVEIGKSNYWSEINQQSTLDSIMQMRLFDNPQTAKLYVELIPEEQLRNKDEILRKLDEEIAAMQQQAVQAQQVQDEGDNVSGGSEMTANQIDETAMEIAQLDPTEQQEVLGALGVTAQDRRRIENAM